MYSIVTFSHVTMLFPQGRRRRIGLLILALLLGIGICLGLTAMPVQAAGIAPDVWGLNLCITGTPPDCPYRYITVTRDADGYLARYGQWFIRFDEKGREEYRLIDPATKGR